MIPPERFFRGSGAPGPKPGRRGDSPDFLKGTSQRNGLTSEIREKRPEHPKFQDCSPGPAENSRPPHPELFPVRSFHEIPRSKKSFPEFSWHFLGFPTGNGDPDPAPGFWESHPRPLKDPWSWGWEKSPEPGCDPRGDPGRFSQPRGIYRDLSTFIGIYRLPPEAKLGQELFQGESWSLPLLWERLERFSSEENPGWSFLVVVPPQRPEERGKRRSGRWERHKKKKKK